MKRWMAVLLAALVLFSALALAEEAAPVEAPAPEETEAPVPDATEPEPLWLLTIRYRYADDSEAQPTLEVRLAVGEPYDVKSPDVAGFLPDVDRVTGVMPGADRTVDVVYRPDPAATTPETASPEPDHPAETISPEPTETAQTETIAPEPTEPGGGWTLTIHYVLPDGGPAAADYVQTSLAAGQAYDVESPVIEGMAADPARVSGVMGEADVTVTVVYGASGEFPGGFPGGGWTLTIHYVLPDGGPAAADYVQTSLAAGQAYDVESPVIEGMAADPARVSGVMGEADVTVTVVYGASGEFPGGFPGGGFPGGSHGGSRPGGASSGTGGPDGAEAAEDPGFRVTPGEAFTSIHSSGDRDDSLYTALDADDETVQALGMSLTASGAEQPFSARWADGALILSGGAGCWRVNGSALRALQNAGVETLVLASGDAAVALPTAGFASGYAYDRLRAQGLASAAFEYAVDPAAGTVQLTAQGTMYDLSGEGGDMRLTGAAFGAASALCAKYAADSE